ncbi:MAG: DUF1127 domain-containing protein [Rhizobiaceae bacterium]|nr:DUF1127 domain-containing protein [Rhizobiaceae bacterium]
MSALDLAPETSLAAGRAALSTRVAVAAGKLFRAWQNRRAFYRLSDMTDMELRDIGLTRADLHVAVASPFGVDPTTRLRTIVETRRFD